MLIQFPDLVSEAANIEVASGALDVDDSLKSDVLAVMQLAVTASVNPDDIRQPDFRQVEVNDAITVVGDGERLDHQLFDKAVEFAGALVTARQADLYPNPVTISYSFPGDKELETIHLTEDVTVPGSSEAVQLVTPNAILRLHMAMFGAYSLLEDAERKARDLIADWIKGQDGAITPDEAVRLFSGDYIRDLPPFATEFLERYKSALIRVFEIGPNPLRTLRAAPQN